MRTKDRLASLLMTLFLAGSATPCSITNCQASKCQDLGGQVFRCLGCTDGFYLKGETQCIGCSEGCSKCGASGQCSACLDGYLLTNAGGCTACGSHCSKCDASACLLCVDASFELVAGACKSTAGTTSSISGPTIGYILLGVFVGLFLLFLIRVNFVKKKNAEVLPANKDSPAKGILKSSDGDSSRLGGRLVTAAENNLASAAGIDQEKRVESDTKTSSSSHPTKLTLRSSQNRLVQLRLGEETRQAKMDVPAPEDSPVAPDHESGAEPAPQLLNSAAQSPRIQPVIVRRIPVKSPPRSPPKEARKSPNLKLAQRKVLGSQIQRISFPYLSNKKQVNWRQAEAEDQPVKEEAGSGLK